jgi:N-acetylmuramoyl-L-alanine amidase
MKLITIKSPNVSSRYGVDPDLIVLHHTATKDGSGLGVARFFSYPSSKVSAHEVVDDNGQRYHCVDWSLAAWHAGTGSWKGRTNLNSRSLGIEIVNKGDGKDAFSTKQLKKVAKIVRQMRRDYPKTKYNIVDHEAISHAGKVDLRKNFPAAKFMWFVLHPILPLPRNPYARLPKWAQRVCDDIKRQDGHIL